jgi:hypothetical protein
MGCGADDAPSTDQLIESVEGGELVDGCVEITGGDPGPQGGALRTDLIGQALAIIEDTQAPLLAKAAGVLALGMSEVIALERSITAAVDKALALVGIEWPSLNALRVNDVMVGLPHPHIPVAPFPPFGPIVRMSFLPQVGVVLEIGFLSGAATVKINGAAAARCGDMGVALPLCLGALPFFEIFLGSATVWFEGQRAGRVVTDVTNDCMACDPALGLGKIGTCVTGSGDVFVGGVPLPSFTDMFMGLIVMVGASGLSRLGKRLARVGFISRNARRLANLPGVRGALARINRVRSAVSDYYTRWQRWIDDARPPPRSYGGAPPRYRTIDMRRGYLYEQYPFNRQWSPFFPQGVTYLDDAGRDARRLFATDGLLHDADGLFNTPSTGRLNDGGPGNILVMDAQGNLYTGQTATGRFQHSSFLGGEPVAFAGEIRVVDGVPTYVSNASGHYHPPPWAVDQLIARLDEMGVDTSALVRETLGG